MRVRDLLLIPAILLLVACGTSGSGDKKEPAHEHPPAPHGGEVLELGDEDYHLEMIHDHDGGNVTVYVLGKDLKTPVAVEAPVIHVNAKSGPVQIPLTAVQPKPDGTADTWKGSHEALRSDPWDGRIRVKIGDKTYQSPLEGEEHSHK
jgi:hypothetical protein